MSIVREIKDLKNLLEKFINAKEKLLLHPEGENLLLFSDLLVENVKHLIVVAKNLFFIKNFVKNEEIDLFLRNLIDIHINLLSDLYSRVGFGEDVKKIFLDLIDIYLKFLLLCEYFGFAEIDSFDYISFDLNDDFSYT